MGAALVFLRRYSEAEQAYHSGLKRDPDNQQLKEGLADAQKYSEDYIKSGYIYNFYHIYGMDRSLLSSQ